MINEENISITIKDCLNTEHNEEEYIDEPHYIYQVEILGYGFPQRLYYLNPEDTHFYFNIENTQIKYIKVNKSMPEYQSAFYASKINNRLKIKNSPSRNIFFG